MFPSIKIDLTLNLRLILIFILKFYSNSKITFKTILTKLVFLEDGSLEKVRTFGNCCFLFVQWVWDYFTVWKCYFMMWGFFMFILIIAWSRRIIALEEIPLTVSTGNLSPIYLLNSFDIRLEETHRHPTFIDNRYHLHTGPATASISKWQNSCWEELKIKKSSETDSSLPTWSQPSPTCRRESARPRKS